jgi:DNA-binding LacI/PurR family transcriptional regulator
MKIKVALERCSQGLEALVCISDTMTSGCVDEHRLRHRENGPGGLSGKGLEAVQWYRLLTVVL